MTAVKNKLVGVAGDGELHVLVELGLASCSLLMELESGTLSSGSLLGPSVAAEH